MLRVQFFDATGNLIERFDAPLDEAMRRIGLFVKLHGTDTDDAMAGSIRFEPI